MSKPENPPAFPVPNIKSNGDLKCAKQNNIMGMSLRDYFAGQSLGGIAHMLALAYNDEQIELAEPQDKKISQMAYELADAMLKAREKSNATS